MSLSGLPPVPKNLAPFLTNSPKYTRKPPTVNQAKVVRPLPRTPPRDPPPPPPTTASLGRKPSTLDAKLAILKKEMAGLRQIDMQLMNRLWSLQQSIQDVKCIMSTSDLSPQSAIDSWELNHQEQNNEDFCRSPHRLSAPNENENISSSTSSISSVKQMERDLPEWMTKTSVTQTGHGKLSNATVPGVMVTGKVCERRLAYLMSPRELQMVAKEILGLKRQGFV